MTTIINILKPKIEIEIFDCSSEKEKVWNIFKNHHYLSQSLNKSSRCFLACWNGVPVGFQAVLPMPCGTLKNAWRGHRCVVLADYQGLGIGNRLSEWAGETLLKEGKRYFSKTANIKMGRYRDSSLKWKPTNKNKKNRKSAELKDNYNNLINKTLLEKRLCYSHEYIGTK